MHLDLPKAAGSSAILNTKMLDGLNHARLVNDAFVQLFGDRQQQRKSFSDVVPRLPAPSSGAQHAPL